MKTRPLAGLLLALLLAAGCAGVQGPAATPTGGAAPTSAPTAEVATAAATGTLRHIRVPVGYIPSVQFAPFYVAMDKGYFAAQGLEVELDYSYETDGVALVGAGQLPFAVVSGEQVLLARAQKLPVVYVMAWFQKFPVAVIAKADAGIDKPEQLRGKRIGTPLLAGANFVGLRALLAAAGVPPESVTVDAIGFNQAPALAAGQVDAAVVYSNNEPIRLAAQGQALSVIQVSDYVSLAANGLMTNEDTLAHDPALVRAFVAAFSHGLADALADPGAAYAISAKYVEDLADPAVEKQVLAATLALCQADHLGRSDPAAWDNMQTALLETGLLTERQDVGKAYTNEFVP